jgi:antitoxin component of MazEF toxin-antitoxin module
MKQNIRKIGNSLGLIIPRLLMQEIGMPEVVDISLTGDGLLISPLNNKFIRRKPRDEDETLGLYDLMKANIERSIKRGKVHWISEREMERTI